MPSDDWHRVSNPRSSDIAMKSILLALTDLLRSALRHHLSLQMEVVALRHQLAIYQRTCRRPHISPADRIWREELFFVKPETIVAWQRSRFRDHCKLLGPGGARSVVADSLLIKQQILVINLPLPETSSRGWRGQ